MKDYPVFDNFVKVENGWLVVGDVVGDIHSDEGLYAHYVKPNGGYVINISDATIYATKKSAMVAFRLYQERYGEK